MNVVNHIVYDAYGNIVSETDGNGVEHTQGDSTYVDHIYAFTGRERDYESDLQYNRARYYDAALGRWISADPIGFAAGDANLYRYVGNSSTIYVDPSGLYFGLDDAVFAIGGAVVGLVGQGVGDLISGELSGWEEYAGSAIGGAVGGEALLYTGPIGAGLAGGAATNLAKQGLKNLSGKRKRPPEPGLTALLG